MPDRVDPREPPADIAGFRASLATGAEGWMCPRETALALFDEIERLRERGTHVAAALRSLLSACGKDSKRYLEDAIEAATEALK